MINLVNFLEQFIDAVVTVGDTLMKNNWLVYLMMLASLALVYLFYAWIF